MIVLDDFDLFMAKILLHDAAVVEEYPLQKIIEFLAHARGCVDGFTHLDILNVLQQVLRSHDSTELSECKKKLLRTPSEPNGV